MREMKKTTTAKVYGRHQDRTDDLSQAKMQSERYYHWARRPYYKVYYKVYYYIISFNFLKVSFCRAFKIRPRWPVANSKSYAWWNNSYSGSWVQFYNRACSGQSEGSSITWKSIFFKRNRVCFTYINLVDDWPQAGASGKVDSWSTYQGNLWRTIQVEKS